MKSLAALLSLLPLAACDPSLGTLRPMNAGYPAAGSMPSFDSSADAQRRRDAEIKRGEDLENEEARKAGFGPSPTEGMNCTTTSNSSGSDNNRTTSTTTHCSN